MKKTILITGSAGFIGFYAAKKLLENNYRVIGVDNLNNYYDVNLKKARNKILLKNKNYKFYRTDIKNYHALEKIFKENKIDKILHLAAQAGVRYGVSHPFVYEESNLKGFLNILECARHNRTKNFVYASSSSVYGGNIMPKSGFSENDSVNQPVSLYATTKRSNELMAYAYHNLYGLNCTGLRFFTVYGPWGRPDMAYFSFTKKITNNDRIEIFNYGKMRRDFTYVDDIVAGIITALNRSFAYEIINLGNSRPEELKYFIELIEKNLGKQAKKKYLPLQPGDVLATYANISKAKKLLNFCPKTKIEEGIKNFVQWYREYYKIV
ncbi:MAG: SDR family NAD(P)-dependent oxidoreductase [Patescibacteria group bacterium]|nr:SDR family NAD(P)-dependent oxidoreductase [Patescibacteria group bacterium]MDD4611071.1 SDR family NAD(P)-dependent oxidoreductase [Patescibacteria group bacterium]